MNDRIKQLAEQVYGSAHHDDFKFAELIVRECAEIAETAEPYNSSDLIKKHFGVED